MGASSELRADMWATAASHPSSSIANSLFLNDQASIAPWRNNHELGGYSDSGELTLPAVLPSMLEPFVTVIVEYDVILAPPPYCERTRGRPQRLIRARESRSLSFLTTECRLSLGEPTMS